MESGNQKADSWKPVNTWLFLAGQGLSMFGSLIAQYAVTWHMTLKTQSGTVMTLFAVAGVLPMFFISPFGGAWADRYNKKLLINIADASIALFTLFMALLLTTGIDSIWPLLACAFVRSVGQGAQTPAVSSLIPELVPEEHLSRVNGLNSSIQSLCMFLAPMASGALLSVAPVQSILLIDVATAAIGISIVFFLVHVPQRKKSEQAKTGTGYFKDIKDGILYVAKQPFIRRVLLVSAIFGFMASPLTMLTPIQTTRNFGLDVWRLPAIELAFSLGMMGGGIIITAWGGFKNKAFTITLATAICGLISVALGLASNFWVYLSFMAICGISFPFFNTPLMTIFQTKVDPDYMGRVFSVLTMSGSVMMPLGMAVFGPLADVVSIDILLVITGIVVFLSSFLIIGSKAMREAGI